MSGKPTNPKLYARARAMVKARVKKWPSAYASGQLVQQYKKMGGKYKWKLSDIRPDEILF